MCHQGARIRRCPRNCDRRAGPRFEPLAPQGTGKVGTISDDPEARRPAFHRRSFARTGCAGRTRELPRCERHPPSCEWSRDGQRPPRAMFRVRSKGVCQDDCPPDVYPIARFHRLFVHRDARPAARCARHGAGRADARRRHRRHRDPRRAARGRGRPGRHRHHPRRDRSPPGDRRRRQRHHRRTDRAA